MIFFAKARKGGADFLQCGQGDRRPTSTLRIFQAADREKKREARFSSWRLTATCTKELGQKKGKGDS
ncbi:MAG: hypothetical protein CVV45_05335 [Spirochaetae bacterium HGW-Spirochaetae-10]|nr:MAG: hypothetical protein CVV45_05335 [Spirochaetae bacterium HGW-Spirochaetae-10]